MDREARRAVQWLEQDYDTRNTWYYLPIEHPDGTPVDFDLRDSHVYKRGFFQVVDDDGDGCGTENPCHCFLIPGNVLGLEWTKADDDIWFTWGYDEGSHAHAKYLRKVHPYLYDKDFDKPNDLDWWRE